MAWHGTARDRESRFPAVGVWRGVVVPLSGSGGAMIQGGSNPGGQTVTGWRREAHGLFRRSERQRSGGEEDAWTVPPEWSEAEARRTRGLFRRSRASGAEAAGG